VQVGAGVTSAELGARHLPRQTPDDRPAGIWERETTERLGDLTESMAAAREPAVMARGGDVLRDDGETAANRLTRRIDGGFGHSGGWPGRPPGGSQAAGGGSGGHLVGGRDEQPDSAVTTARRGTTTRGRGEAWGDSQVDDTGGTGRALCGRRGGVVWDAGSLVLFWCEERSPLIGYLRDRANRTKLASKITIFPRVISISAHEIRARGNGGGARAFRGAGSGLAAVCPIFLGEPRVPEGSLGGARRAASDHAGDRDAATDGYHRGEHARRHTVEVAAGGVHLTPHGVQSILVGVVGRAAGTAGLDADEAAKGVLLCRTQGFGIDSGATAVAPSPGAQARGVRIRQGGRSALRLRGGGTGPSSLVTELGDSEADPETDDGAGVLRHSDRVVETAATPGSASDDERNEEIPAEGQRWWKCCDDLRRQVGVLAGLQCDCCSRTLPRTEWRLACDVHDVDVCLSCASADAESATTRARRGGENGTHRPWECRAYVVWVFSVCYVILRVRIELDLRTYCRDMGPPVRLSGRVFAVWGRTVRSTGIFIHSFGTLLKSIYLYTI
jgi:hypothetical protein